MRITIHSELARAIIDTKGAELKSFMHKNGHEYIWCGDPKHWSGTSPVLFPMIGNLRDDKTIIEGKEYKISKHGFARDYEFQVIEQSEHRVVFSLRDRKETLEVYPYHFDLRLVYAISGTSLTLTYEVYNLDEKEMLYHIGAHPAFNCPMIEGEKFSDYILQFEQIETCMSPLYDLNNLNISNDNRICHLDHSDTMHLDYSMFQNDAIIFDDIKSRKVSLINPSTKKGIAVDYHGFNVIAFWTPRNDTAPFLCIEPWNGSAIYSDEDNDFAHKRCIQRVKPREHQTYRLIFDIIS